MKYVIKRLPLKKALLLLSASLAIQTAAYAEYYGQHYSTSRPNPHNFPPVEKRAYVQATCKECDDLAEQYNSIVDKLYKADSLYRDIEISIYSDEEFINKDLDIIYSVQLEKQTPAVADQLSNAVKNFNNDSNDLHNHYNELTQLRTVEIAKLKYDLFSINKKFQACEAGCAKTSVSRTTTSSTAMAVSPTVVDMGIVGGNLSSTHKTSVDNDLGIDTTRKSQNNGLIGLQAQVTFDPPLVRPFVLANFLATINASQAFSGLSSNYSVSNDWMMHAMVGAETFPFWQHFTAGIGVGAAIINQGISGTVVSGGKTYSASHRSTSLAPSWLAHLTWLGCDSCVYGHGGSIALQIAGDQYPSIKANGATAGGGTFQFKSNQQWQYSEMLVFSVRV